MTSTVTRIQQHWHPNASSYVQDTEPLSAKERAEWDANVDQTLGRYGADVPDDAVPDADAVHFFSVSQGSSNRWKTIAGVYIGSTLRLWSARVYPTQAQKKAASRLTALQLLACNIDQHFQRYNGDQRSSAAMSRLKSLRVIKGLSIEEAALALNDNDAALHAKSIDPSFIRAMDLRNQNLRSLGVRLGSLVKCVVDGLSAGESDADVLDGLERLRSIMEGSAAALVDAGVVRVAKDRNRLTKRQRTLLYGYERVVKVQGALVTAATLKESADAGSKVLSRWTGSHLRTVGVAFELIQDYREKQGQRRDRVLDRAMDSLKRQGFCDAMAEESEESDDANAPGPSTNASRTRNRRRRPTTPSSSSSTTTTGRAIYTVALAPPGPSSSSSARPRLQIWMPAPSKASRAAARSSAAAVGLSPSASPSPRRSPTPGPASAPATPPAPSSPSSGPATAAPAAAPPSPGGRAQAVLSWLRRSLSLSPAATPVATPAAPSPQMSPASLARSGPSSPPSPHSSAVTPPRPPRPSAAGPSSPTTPRPAPSLPAFTPWNFPDLPTTADFEQLRAFMSTDHQRKDVAFECRVSRAQEAFIPRQHRATSRDWRNGLPVTSTKATLLDAGAVMGVPSNAYADAILLAFTYGSEVTDGFSRLAQWGPPCLSAHPKRQRVMILLASLIWLYDNQMLKVVCAGDLVEAVRHLPDEAGNPLAETHGPWAGNALQFYDRIWRYVVRLVLPFLFKNSMMDVRERRRCTSCGHIQCVESQATSLTMGTVMNSKVVFSRLRTEIRPKQHVNLDEICESWRSERALEKLVCPNPACQKVGSLVATSEVFNNLPKLITFKLDMPEDLPLRMRLPTGRVDMSALLRDGGPVCHYVPSAYVLHEGANPESGHYTVFGREQCDDSWFFHDPRTPWPAPKITRARLGNEKAPTRGRPILLFFDKESNDAGPIPRDKGFIVTEASRVDTMNPALSPRPPPAPCSGGIPLKAKRQRRQDEF